MNCKRVYFDACLTKNDNNLNLKNSNDFKNNYDVTQFFNNTLN